MEVDRKKLNKSLAFGLILIGIFIFIQGFREPGGIISLIGLLGGGLIVAVEIIFLIRSLLNF